MDTTQFPEVLTADEVAKILRVERKTVYNLFREGKIPCGKRVGRVIRFSKKAVFEWLNTTDGAGKKHR